MYRKRFCDRDIYDSDWFVALTPDQKLMYDYISKKCSEAGIWKVGVMKLKRDIGLAEKPDIDDFVAAMNEDGKARILKIKGDTRLFLTGTVEFLNKGKDDQVCYLPENHPARNAIVKELRGFEETAFWLDDKILNGDISLNRNIEKRTGKHRQEISAGVKDIILMRDDITCQYCGKEGEFNTLVTDHVIPKAKGGDNSNTNLVTACIKCNSLKADQDVNEFLLINQFTPGPTLQKILSIPLRTPRLPHKDSDKEKDKDILLDSNSSTKKKVTVNARARESEQNKISNDPSFLAFYTLYDKKKSQGAAMKLFGKLSEGEKKVIMDYLPGYLKATPNKQYRLNPDNFLRNRAWEDELVENGISLGSEQHHYSYTEALDRFHRRKDSRAKFSDKFEMKIDKGKKYWIEK